MKKSLVRPMLAISAMVALGAIGGLSAGHDAVRAAGAQAAAAAPLALHPDNPHYFLWQGRPAILITSAEHYGAVMNLDFDYRRYLDTLAADGMNYTRVFSGAYVEPEGAFKIARNTLAPAAGRFIAPWARGTQAGYANGGSTRGVCSSLRPAQRIPACGDNTSHPDGILRWRDDDSGGAGRSAAGAPVTGPLSRAPHSSSSSRTVLTCSSRVHIVYSP